MLSHITSGHSDIETWLLLSRVRTFYSPSHQGGLSRIPKSALRLPALREPAAPAEGAAFAELQEAAAIRTLGAKAEVVLIAALGAIG